MRLPGFVGPSYVGASPNVAIQTLRNLMPQSVEAAEPVTLTYYQRPGLEAFVVLPTAPLRAVFQQDDLMVAVGGQVLYSVDANGVATPLGTLSATDTNPATITSSGTAGHQLYITSGGSGDIYDTIANTLTPVTATGYPSDTAMGTYVDTYFLTTKGDSAQFNISDLLDGTAWSSLDFAVRIQASDNLVGIIQFNKMIWLIGSQTSEPWYNSGAASFPFQSVPQILIPMGCCAPFSITRTSQALCWLHQSERGRGIFVAATDYSPKRISTYALENLWQTYPTMADCVAYGLTWDGHELVVVNFPSGNATWVYDFTESLWSQWTYHNPVTNGDDRFRGWVHCQGFGEHFVGDWETGVIYRLDATLGTDGGDPVVWERTAPHLNTQKINIFYSDFLLDMETGLGGDAPTVNLSWSDDGGHTFSNAIAMSTGATGDYPLRCRAAGTLGRSRDRAFRVRGNNTKPARILDASCEMVRGTS